MESLLTAGRPQEIFVLNHVYIFIDIYLLIKLEASVKTCKSFHQFFVGCFLNWNCLRSLSGETWAEIKITVDFMRDR